MRRILTNRESAHGNGTRLIAGALVLLLALALHVPAVQPVSGQPGDEHPVATCWVWDTYAVCVSSSAGLRGVESVPYGLLLLVVAIITDAAQTLRLRFLRAVRVPRPPAARAILLLKRHLLI